MAVTKLLVANRGEIAVRVLRTARRLGLSTVAVYSDADAALPHVALADEAVRLGPPPAAESYLLVEALLEAAKRTGADAIHPGYGFLSENAAFARACEEAGVTFVGPPAAAIELMGNKAGAKRAMIAAGVPCVPGYEGEDQSPAAFAEHAARIGFPVMVKAAAGGGGRGMRLVQRPEDLPEAVRSAAAEAASAFGSPELILEKAVVEPRHVEIQIFGDHHGNVIHLGERDCSVQRRHQKVIEEAPSPAVNEALRHAMGEAAVQAGRACGYHGAGTVELLLDREGSFYFLEMNTRLQVEHPVTEMVTGLDLVAWQIAVARGEPLPLTQDQVTIAGHAIEARLYAEDPSRGFLPQTGRLSRFEPSSALRVDAGVQSGDSVSPFYDPMVAKMIAHAPSRGEACRKLAQGLDDTVVFGVRSNKTFLARILRHSAFVGGEATTAFIAQHFADDPSCRVVAPRSESLARAAVAIFARGLSALEDASLLGWRSGGPLWSALDLEHDDGIAAVKVTRTGSGRLGPLLRVTVGEVEHDVELVGFDGRELVLLEGGVRRRFAAQLEGEVVWLDDGICLRVEDVTHRPAQAADARGSGRLTAPLDGAVTACFVEPGAEVEEGTLVMVIEAMKMEHRIEADVKGTLRALHAKKGDQVKTRQLLAEIEPGGEG
ncbi:MAG: acetyl-CoA carboxylase biotin carboxylase subunit [Polyangiaceae bacterium]